MGDYDSTEVPVRESKGNGNFPIAVVFAATCIIIWGMIADNQRVALAITCGIAFFSFLVVMVMLVQTGQLVAAYHIYQKEKTLREQNKMQYELLVREPLQITAEGEKGETNYAPIAPNFVPARPNVSEEVKVAAYAWVMPLFKDGSLDTEKVLGAGTRSPGQVQAKKPAPEVLEYLLGLEVVSGGGKGEMLFFNAKAYDSLRKCQQAIKYGLPLRRVEDAEL